MIQSEGQRATNLAREFTNRGVPVVFGAWRWGPRDTIRGNGDTEGILQLPLDQITRYPDELFSSLAGCERMLIIEFPHPDFVELMATANAQGWITVYDAIDDWGSFASVGQAPWYEEAAEKSLAANVDFVASVSQTLAGKIRSSGVMDVLIVPNGMVEGIDIVGEKRQLRRGAVTLGYWGYVTNAWFNWPLIIETAREVPDWVFYICGYGDGLVGRRLPENVVVLGKTPQTALASIAENLDVGLVPFLPGQVSDAADPVKVYEYLAMGLPVVVTGVKPPIGAEDHVLQARDGDEFRRLIRQAAAMRGVRADERRAYAQARTWGKRLDALLEAIDRGDQGVGQKRWLFQEST
jgi:glycosyltransferase involved in cell wall biosynthesis